MRRLLSYGAALAILASCGRPIAPRECLPTTAQPERGAEVVILGRVDGCEHLVVVSAPSAPGALFYMLPERLDLSDEQLLSLPVIARGEG